MENERERELIQAALQLPVESISDWLELLSDDDHRLLFEWTQRFAEKFLIAMQKSALRSGNATMRR